MIRTLTAAAAAALALTLGAATLGPGPARAGSDDTLAALNACAAGYPDPARISAGLGAAGLGDMGRIVNGGQALRLFVSPDGKTYAGSEGTGGVACMIVENRLSARKAEGLARALAAQMPGASELPAPKGGGLEVTKMWTGMLADRMTVLMVVKSYAIRDVKGAALLVVAQ